jgi:GNAT superfamily N-acetyltransferase
MIREATAADKFRLVEMTTRFILESQYHHWLAGATPERISDYVDAVLERGVIFVAEGRRRNCCDLYPDCECDVLVSRPGELIGMLAILPFKHPLTDRLVAEEFAWWVEPEHRKGAVGPRLLRHMEHWCAEKTLHMVKMVAPAGTSVGAFYEKCGYQALETHWIKVLTDGSDDKPRDSSSARRRPSGG